jgi:ferredoxin
MDCFVEGPNFLAIDPEGCIDCSVCVAECPVGAIVNAAEATEAQKPYIELNARLARDDRWKPITRTKAPLDEHDRWAAVTRKRHLLEGEAAPEI